MKHQQSQAKQQNRIIAKKGIANKPYGETQKFSVKKSQASRLYYIKSEWFFLYIKCKFIVTKRICHIRKIA